VLKRIVATVALLTRVLIRVVQHWEPLGRIVRMTSSLKREFATWIRERKHLSAVKTPEQERGRGSCDFARDISAQQWVLRNPEFQNVIELPI